MERWNHSIYPKVLSNLFTHLEERIFPPIVFPSDLSAGNESKQKNLRKKCDLFLIDGGTPSAMVEPEPGGRLSIGYTTGFVMSLWELANFLVCTRLFNFSPFCENISIKIPKERVDTIFYNYDWVTGLPNYVAFTDIFLVNPDNQVRKFLAFHIVDFAMAWILLHERAHILKGHVQFLKANYGAETMINFLKTRALQRTILPSNETIPYIGQQLEIQSLELDADRQATLELIHRNLQPSIWNVYPREIFSSNKVVLYYTGVAIASVHLILRLLERNTVLDPLHPQVAQRLHWQFIVWMSLNESCSNLNLQDDEIQAVDSGANRVLDFSDWLFDETGLPILPTRKSFTSYGDKSMFGKESREKLDILIKVLSDIRPQLTPDI